MRHGHFTGAQAGLIWAGCLGLTNLTGQVPAAAAKKPAAAKTWVVPRTPDGHPDFQGVWDMTSVTPLERPVEFAGKAFLTEQEAAEYERRALQQVNTDRRDGGAQVDLNRNYNEFWRDRGPVAATRRTSLIVDPPDGRIPPLTPEARKKRASVNRLAQGPEDLALRLRCISRGLPLVPTPNNNFFQFVQSAGTVAILGEMMHEARIIPLSTQPHMEPRIRGYMGDSRGHWEGNTLRIDTTNFIGINDFYGADEALHLTERITRTDADTLLYEFTVNDPSAFTKPWSGEIPLRKTSEGVFPYECHEGNYSVPNILEGARREEKSAATK